MVGEAGLMLTWEPSAPGGTLLQIDTGVQATLYGIWAPSPHELWAVGGVPEDPNQGGVILWVVGGQVVEVKDLPPELPKQADFFKVWGHSAHDVWVAGELGTLLHWDGRAWQLVGLDALAGKPRIVTVHGSGPEDVVAVGGASQAVVLEGGASRPWTLARLPGAYPGLNGVFVAQGGRAVAAGFLGAVLERRPGEGWSEVPWPPYQAHWHATLIDAAGAIWVAGGDLLDPALPSGLVARYLGSDAPRAAEPQPDLGPEPSPEPPPEAAPLEARTAEPDPGAPEAEPAEEAEQAETPVLDAGPLAPAMVLGWIPPPGGGFVPFPNGEEVDVEIVQGPQGGIHAEVAFELSVPLEEAATLKLPMQCTTTIDGVLEGLIKVPTYTVYRTPDGAYRSAVIPIFFAQNGALAYQGRKGVVACQVSLDGTEPADLSDLGTASFVDLQ
jgi:hypothetical protein